MRTPSMYIFKHILLCFVLGLGGCITDRYISYSAYDPVKEWQAPYVVCFQASPSAAEKVCVHATTKDLTLRPANLLSIEKSIQSLAPDLLILENILNDAAVKQKGLIDALTCTDRQNCTEIDIALKALQRLPVKRPKQSRVTGGGKTTNNSALPRDPSQRYNHFVGIEPSSEDEQRSIIEQSNGELTARDYLGLLLSRALISHTRLKAVDKMDLQQKEFLQKILNHLLTTKAQFASLATSYTLSDFEGWLHRHTNSPMAQVPENFLVPSLDNNALVTRRLSAFARKAREIKLLETIQRAKSNHSVILVIYDVKHLQKLFPKLSAAAKHIDYAKYH